MSIAQDIRDYAISRPGSRFLGEVECSVIAAFDEPPETPWECCPVEHWGTFVLFVAEALDGGTAGRNL